MPGKPKKKMCQTYKVIVVGDNDVGKSSLLRQMTDFEPLSTTDSVPKDYHSKMAIVEGASAPVKVQLWDTAGQEKFGAARLPSSYYRHANAAIVVYDVTNRLSFAAVLRWVMQIQTYQSTAVPDSLFSIVLVGNKTDAANGSRQVGEAEGRQVSRIIGASNFFECSSRDGTNTQECFNTVAALLVKGPAWSLPLSCSSSVTSDLDQRPNSASKTRRDAAPLDVVTPSWSPTLSTTAPIAACSPTMRLLSAKSGPPVMGTSFLGTLAVLMSMPMVLLWLDDDAVLRMAEALWIQ
ncbi:hypothetical protein PR002_g13607 [Phytophthora rubi]|uniref:Ras-related protein n=2 Tax=Phytophthora rubi TaxID=129364 RepID=A0A6A3LF03_9STRA|nr:hypothetical protein PR002_g13607 [Phytophthora rubi]